VNENDCTNLTFVVSHDGARPSCRARGEIDLTNVAAIAKVLASFVEVGEEEIDLDLSDVEFIDSQGINALLRAHLAGLRIFITAASPMVRRVLEICRIEDVIGQPPDRS